MLELDRVGARELRPQGHLLGDRHVAQVVVAPLGDDVRGLPLADDPITDRNVHEACPSSSVRDPTVSARTRPRCRARGLDDLHTPTRRGTFSGRREARCVSCKKMSVPPHEPNPGRPAPRHDRDVPLRPRSRSKPLPTDCGPRQPRLSFARSTTAGGTTKSSAWKTSLRPRMTPIWRCRSGRCSSRSTTATRTTPTLCSPCSYRHGLQGSFFPPRAQAILERSWLPRHSSSKSKRRETSSPASAATPGPCATPSAASMCRCFRSWSGTAAAPA
jgi:hypothetical protein